MIQTGPGASAPPSFHPKWEPIEAALKTCEPVHLTKPFCVFGHCAISVFLVSFEGGGHCLGSFVALVLDGEACVLFCFLFFLFFFAHEHASASRGLSNNIDPLSPLGGGASLQGYAKRDTTNQLAHAESPLSLYSGGSREDSSSSTRERPSAIAASMSVARS